MTYKFGNTSTSRILTCHQDIQKLFYHVIRNYNCSVLCGHRSENEQNAAFADKKSKLKWPQSKHNSDPSTAIDIAPFPIDWEDHDRFYHFAGYVLANSERLKIKVRWGGDWDSDKEFKDQKFNDLVHWELL